MSATWESLKLPALRLSTWFNTSRRMTRSSLADRPGSVLRSDDSRRNGGRRSSRLPSFRRSLHARRQRRQHRDRSSNGFVAQHVRRPTRKHQRQTGLLALQGPRAARHSPTVDGRRTDRHPSRITSFPRRSLVSTPRCPAPDIPAKTALNSTSPRRIPKRSGTASSGCTIRPACRVAARRIGRPQYAAARGKTSSVRQRS